MPTKRDDTSARIDRIERAAAANDEFRALVRSAFTVQQDQITELRKSTADLRDTVQQLAREWQA